MQTCRCRCFVSNYFRSWMIRICRVLDEKEDHNEPQLPVFVFVLTKFKKMPNIASVSMGCMASMEISVTPYWVYSPGDNSRRFIIKRLELSPGLYTQYKLYFTTLQTCHFTTLQTCSFTHQIHFCGMNSATLQILCKDYPFTHFYHCQ